MINSLKQHIKKQVAIRTHISPHLPYRSTFIFFHKLYLSYVAVQHNKPCGITPYIPPPHTHLHMHTQSWQLLSHYQIPGDLKTEHVMPHKACCWDKRVERNYYKNIRNKQWLYIVNRSTRCLSEVIKNITPGEQRNN